MRPTQKTYGFKLCVLPLACTSPPLIPLMTYKVMHACPLSGHVSMRGPAMIGAQKQQQLGCRLVQAYGPADR